jgi:hypothetical protein
MSIPTFRFQRTTTRPAALFTTVLSCCSLALGLAESLRIAGGLAETDGVLAAPAAGEASLSTATPLPAGFHRLVGEYRTIGFAPLGRFAMEAKKPDRSASYSNYDWIGASSGWAPLELHMRLPEGGNTTVRLCDFRAGGAGARVELRNLAIEPVEFGALQGKSWLEEEFAAGTTGELPAGWYWQAEPASAESNALVPNTSFRTGKHVLRLVGDPNQAREIRHRTLPIPNNGELTFSVWARAAEPVRLGLHIVQHGWSKRAEKGHTLTTAWQRYDVSWPVPNPREKDGFFLRIDIPAGTVPIEVADLRLEWRGEGPVAAVDPHAAALARGWQGVPGKNLLYNPDLELGGTGFFYDFSWPKTYQHYENLYTPQPIELLAGQGVDGGTCAHVRGSSLRAYCFPVTVGQTYTLSADLRAPAGKDAAECRVWAFDSEWNCALAAKQDGISGAEWKRYHWTFQWKPDNIQKRGYVRFDSPGVLVDRIQVVEGTARDYEAPPVMLGLVYDRWPYFVRGRDEAKARIRVVPGVPKPGMAGIEVVASDAWGREVWRKAFDAPLDKATEVPVDLPTDRLGVFHLDLKARSMGAGLTMGIGVGRYAVIEPAYLQPRTPGRPGLAGICQESFGFPLWLSRDHAAIQTDIGIRLNRFFASIPPDLPEPMPNAFKEYLNATCAIFGQAGIDVMPCVELIPESASQGARNLDPARPQDLESFEKHLGAYVAALKDTVPYFEVFNEPNLWRMPSGPDAGKRTMGPLKYLEFQKVAHAAIKAVDPRLQVVAPGLNNVDFEWIEEWMKAGGGAYMDVFSFHPYSETDFFPQGTQLEKVMREHGFAGPLVNSEKYFGANLFYDRQGYEETRRGYYLPHDGELKTAGRSIQHFVSSVAVGVPVAFFNPTGTISRRGPATELFVYDFFAAYNAAIRLVAPAGRGERVELGPTATALVFPDAPGGLLVALWTPQLNLEGSLSLAGDITVFDMMGNTVPPAQRLQGVRVATDLSYVRFPAGTATPAVRDALRAADLYGMGDPFKVALSIGGGRSVVAWVASQRNKPLSGTARIASLPEGWSLPPPPAAFADLPAAETVRVDFPLGGVAFRSMREYPVSVVVESGDEFVRSAKGAIQVDGKLEDWADAEWIALGAEHLSKVFDGNQRLGGPDDLSARFAAAWTAEALALAVVVTDDQHQTVEAPALAWQGDSVQVYFDPLNDAMPDRRNADDDIEYLLSLIGETSHAWLVKGSEGNYRGEANRVDGFADVDARCKIVREGTTTTYELLLPKRPCLPGVALEADAAFGFSLLINDSDGSGRKIGLTLAPKGSEPYGRPDEYRDLILAEKESK